MLTAGLKVSLKVDWWVEQSESKLVDGSVERSVGLLGKSSVES